MKKALLTIAVVIAAMSVQAQNVRVGLTGGVNSTWLMNKNVFDANDKLDIAASFGGRFGFEGIYSFSDKAGLSVGVNFISTNNQKYTGDLGGGTSFEAKAKLNYIDVPLLFRLTSGSGTYFEVGPQFGFLSKATEEFTLSPVSAFNYTDKDVKNSFESTNVALVFGFGVDIDVTEHIFITTGLRLGYGFSDVTKEYSSATALPDAGPGGTNSLANYWAHYEDADTGTNSAFKYEKTSRVFGGLNLGVSYKFGGDSKK